MQVTGPGHNGFDKFWPNDSKEKEGSVLGQNLLSLHLPVCFLDNDVVLNVITRSTSDSSI